MSTPPWGTQKSYLIPALEIVGFETLLNLFDRAYFGCCDFDTDFSSIKRNLSRSWDVDSDEFTVNQLGHPYQGSMYHGFARASGLNYWQGLAYTFVGSVLWEIAGETTRPSINDQISTGIGGSFLGEALFRMSNLWLEKATGPSFWRELVGAVISPPVGFNRLAFGERFKGIFPSKDPEYYSRVQVGIASATEDRPAARRRSSATKALLISPSIMVCPASPDIRTTVLSTISASRQRHRPRLVSRAFPLVDFCWEPITSSATAIAAYGVCTAVTIIWRRRFFAWRVRHCLSARPASGDSHVLCQCKEPLSSAPVTPPSAPLVASPTSGRINTALPRRHSWLCD